MGWLSLWGPRPPHPQQNWFSRCSVHGRFRFLVLDKGAFQAISMAKPRELGSFETLEEAQAACDARAKAEGWRIVNSEADLPERPESAGPWRRHDGLWTRAALPGLPAATVWEVGGTACLGWSALLGQEGHPVPDVEAGKAWSDKVLRARGWRLD